MSDQVKSQLIKWKDSFEKDFLFKNSILVFDSCTDNIDWIYWNTSSILWKKSIFQLLLFVWLINQLFVKSILLIFLLTVKLEIK